MTNFEFIKSLSETQMATLFTKLRLDAAEAEDWMKFFAQEADMEFWSNIGIKCSTIMHPAHLGTL